MRQQHRKRSIPISNTRSSEFVWYSSVTRALSDITECSSELHESGLRPLAAYGCLIALLVSPGPCARSWVGSGDHMTTCCWRPSSSTQVGYWSCLHHHPTLLFGCCWGLVVGTEEKPIYDLTLTESFHFTASVNCGMRLAFYSTLYRVIIKMYHVDRELLNIARLCSYIWLHDFT